MQYRTQGKEVCVDYLNDTYVSFFRHRFIKCYINKILHFDTTTTSRGEGGHAVLKRQLGSSSGNLKTVVDGINLLLVNELHNHLIQLDEAKVRLPMELRKPIFQELSPYVTPFALRKILTQYNLLSDRPTAIPACQESFTSSTGLLCSHKIQERLYEGRQLLVEDVYPHWRFDRAPVTVNNNPHLLIQESEIARTWGRPPGAENRRQQAFETSTNREPSLFERLEAETGTTTSGSTGESSSWLWTGQTGSWKTGRTRR